MTRRGDVSPTARTAWAAGQRGRLVATGALAERADLAIGRGIRSLQGCVGPPVSLSTFVCLVVFRASQSIGSSIGTLFFDFKVLDPISVAQDEWIVCYHRFRDSIQLRLRFGMQIELQAKERSYHRRHGDDEMLPLSYEIGHGARAPPGKASPLYAQLAVAPAWVGPRRNAMDLPGPMGDRSLARPVAREEQAHPIEVVLPDFSGGRGEGRKGRVGGELKCLR